MPPPGPGPRRPGIGLRRRGGAQGFRAVNAARPALRLAACLFALPGAAAIARAELKWDATEATIRTKSWTAHETVKFGFTNAGTAPVRLVQVAPGCGCTAAQLARETIPAGERGEITLEFHPANKVGTVRIPVRVQTDTEGETTLQLVATIDEGVQLSARFLFWRTGEPRETRRVQFTITDRESIELGEAATTNPAFAVRLAPVAGGAPGEYELAVTPPAESGPAFAAVTVRTKEGPDRVERMHTVVARTF